MNNFSEKIKQFIDFSQNNISSDEIRNEYLKLVKEYHPDANRDIDFNLANEYMMNINYVYEHLLNKKSIPSQTEDEYESNMENGKYWFINDYGVKEYVNEKPLFIYKLGLLEYQKCYKIMFHNSVFDGKKDESGYEVIKHLYSCYLLAHKVIKMDKNGMYGNMARVLLKKAFKMNKNITNGLRKSSEKGLVKK